MIDRGKIIAPKYIIQTWASALLFYSNGQCESLGKREEQQYRLSRLLF